MARKLKLAIQGAVVLIAGGFWLAFAFLLAVVLFSILYHALVVPSLP